MNVIFLDFDGVLNSVRSTVGTLLWDSDDTPFDEKLTGGDVRNASAEQKARWHKQFDDNQWRRLDPIAIGLIERLCKEGPASVVISSTWRIGRTVKDFQERFEELNFDIPVIACTPDLDTTRGLEIRFWLQEQTSASSPWTINNFVILDDDSDMTDEQKAKHFVHVSNQEGLLLKHYRAALRILNPTHLSLVQFDKYNDYPA